MKKLIALISLVAICPLMLAAVSQFGWTKFHDVYITANPLDSNSKGMLKVDGGIGWKHYQRDVDLTSPTVTFAVTREDDEIILSSDANQTGIYPTGGVVGQQIEIRSGASGSNTMRFDDGSKTILGGNITLTEAQYDYLTLECVNSSGDVWAAVSAHDN